MLSPGFSLVSVFQSRKTYKVCRVQDAVLHRVGQVQGELPDSPLFGLLANSWPLLFDLRREDQAQNFRPDSHSLIIKSRAFG